MNKQPEYFEGSGNVFADLEVENADMELAKAELAFAIRSHIRARDLTQKQAALLLHTDQGKISAIMSGKVSGYSYDRLMRYLKKLNCDVTITVKSDCTGKLLVETS